MNVKELFQEFSPNSVAHLPLDLLHQPVLGVTADSRQVKPGIIFVAVCGGVIDGHTFIQEVDVAGALLILGEKDFAFPLEHPYLKVSDTRLFLTHLAAVFYGKPSESLLMIGVTGTSGKTTTSYLIESILLAAGHRVGLIGTIHFRFGNKVFPSTHTTPGPIELQGLLASMKQEGCTAVVMEVSSHALKQKRVGSICFDGMVFTNLSPEHLDFHPDMEDYFQSKALLFTDLVEFSLKSGKFPVVAVNSADPYGQRLLRTLKKRSDVLSGSLGFDPHPDLKISLEGIQGELNGVPIQSAFVGDFNCSNIAGAVALCQSLRIPFDQISQGIRFLKGVPGRLERVENDCGLSIWVDYAHKPDALEKVIQTLAKIRNGHRLVTVFGCGGDRDRKKRSVMGKIAVEGSDHVVITSDNPRTEDPSFIIQEILVGTEGYKNFEIELDRRKAIFRAIQSSHQGDLILIAGKGHEDYQIIGTTKVHLDDREVAREAIETLRYKE